MPTIVVDESLIWYIYRECSSTNVVVKWYIFLTISGVYYSACLYETRSHNVKLSCPTVRAQCVVTRKLFVISGC